MKKLLFLSLCLLVMSTVASFAQNPCHAQYSWVPSQSTSSNALGVQFNNSSTGSSGGTYYSLSYISFGDGSSNIIGASTFHNYAAPGTYYTWVAITTIDSMTSNVICIDTAAQMVTINYLPCAVAISTVDHHDGSVTFTANNLGGTTGMTYTWNFGDGTTGSGSPVTHNYGSGGYHWILLNSNGASCTGSDSMYLHNLDTASVSCDSLQADFTSSVSGLTGYFSNTSTMLSLGISNESDWYFGDGSSDLNNYGNTMHTYSAAGTYNVTLVNRWVDSFSGQLYCVDSFTSSVTATVPNYNFISGNIFLDSMSAPINFDSIKVWLITYDSSANSLTAVDSMSSNSYAPYYQFNNKPAGNYLVKAAVIGQTAGTTGFVPTYHLSSVYWSSATNIAHGGGVTSGKDIVMQTGTVTSGPGFVGGNISMGAGRGTGTGIEGMQVYLRGANNALVASAVTDEDGNFSFSNIPLGIYNVYPEAINNATTPYDAIAVTASQAHITTIDFEQKNNLIYPKKEGPTGISKITKADGLNVYPNPAKTQLIIENSNNLFNSVHIVNTLGQTIQQNKLVNGINKIGLANVTSGIYYLLISGPDGSRSQKIIKE